MSQKNSIISTLKKANLEIERQAIQLNWDKVSQLFNSRHQLIEAFCESQKSQMTQALLTEIQQLINLNDDNIRLIITQQKKTTIQKNLNLQNAFNGAHQYQTTVQNSSNS